MPLDAVCLAAVAEELRGAVVGGRIDKIHQPGRDEVVLSLRGAGENVKLLLSANPAHPRAHLTRMQRENPDVPPMFCMLLRKYLTGGRIISVTQPSMERILEFTMEVTDELGDRGTRKLVLEAMGRSANLILLDGDGRITDCARRVDADLSERRQLLPGLFYRYPPAQNKENPLECGRERMLELILNNAREPDKRLLDAFTGLSPLIARELAFRAGPDGTADLLADQLFRLTEDIRALRFTPYLLVRDESPVDFTFLPILQYGAQTELKRFGTFSQLLDDFYSVRETRDRLRQKSQDLVKLVTNKRDRVRRKLANQTKELDSALNRERLRELGDIVTSNLHLMKKGMGALTAADFYAPDCGEILIPLDPLLTPQQNAAKYYKEYNKAKTAELALGEQLKKGQEELSYLNSVLESLQFAEGERDLQEIRQELTDTGYLCAVSGKKGREKRELSKPMEFRSTGGLRISVGKNNAQNDRLTSKLAGKGDIWLHTQKIHGSHVILWTEGSRPDDRSLTEAAMLAAWFSQGREGQNVPVDYTPVKFVKKPAGAKPGMVIYHTYETAYVTPDGSLAGQLRVK